MAEGKMHTVELSDEELEAVHAGYTLSYEYDDDGYFEYTGNDVNQKYICPKCLKPVHAGIGWRFYCDPCNDSWFFEDELYINRKSGAWTKIPKDEYMKKVKGLL